MSSGRDASLWVDVSTLLHWDGKITGIPRTIAQFVEALSNQAGLRLRLCGYNVWLRTYEEVPADILSRKRPAPKPFAPAPKASAARPSAVERLRPLYRLLPTDLQNALKDFCRALKHLGRFFFVSGRKSAANLAKGLVRRAARLVRPRNAEIIFRDGDVLFMPGASWSDFGACEALERIQRDIRLHVVPIVYDVIPAKMPQACGTRLPLLFPGWLRKLLARSDLVLTISEFSRRDLLAVAAEWGVTAPPVEVIRLGDAPAGVAHAARPAGLPAAVGSFALSVGTLEVRKNHWALYQTWRRLIEEMGAQAPALVLAGRPGWGTGDLVQQIRDDPLVRGRVFVLSSASDEELAWLYENCLFTLFPSQYEGWGLPVAESLAHGKACICSNATSVPEVGGALVDYHDPLDVMGCLSLVRRALSEPDFLPAREARIRTDFRLAAWADCAARLVPLIERHLAVRLAYVAPQNRATVAA